jgi:hypothetical protein
VDVDNLSVDTFSKYLKKANDIDLANQNLFPFSTKGKNILYNTISLKIWPKLPDGRKDDRQEFLKIIN